MNSKRTAKLYKVLKSATSTNILNELMFENKTFSFFKDKYGKQTRYTLAQLESEGLIKKLFDKFKIPIGYKLTSKGRHALHVCMKFNKDMENVLK